MKDTISRRAAIDALDVGAELLRRVLDDADIVGDERAKYEWGLGLIESYISDMKEISSAQPETHEERTETHACDCISRQAAIDVLYKNYILGRGDLNEVLDHIVDRLEKLPSAEPRKKGKWIDCDGSEHWKCDKCGCRAGYWFNEENSSSWELDMSEWLSNFCPNCGAEMGDE